MVGLNAHETAQLRALLKIRRLISFRRFKGRPQELIFTIVFLVFALPIPIMLATFSNVAYRKLPPPWNIEILDGVLGLLWLAWLLAPVAGAQLNEAPDMSRFLALPIRRRVMIIATFAGSVFDYSTYFTLPFLLAILFGGWGSAATIIAVFAVLVAALHFIAAGQLVTTVTSGLLRSRRYQDFAAVVGSLMMLVYWWWHMRNMRTEHNEPPLADLFKRMAENDIHPMSILQWTPPGACARAIERAWSGHMGQSLVWLGASALTLVGIAAVWWWAQERIATQGEFIFGAPARRAHKESRVAGRDERGHIPFLRPAVVAIAALDLRQMWRNPARRMQTIQGLIMPVILSVVWFGREHLGGSILALAPAIFVTFVSLFTFQNVLGTDGLAVATVFMSPLDRRDVFRGKVLAFATIAAGPVLLLCLLAMVRASVPLGIAAAFLSAATFLVIAAISSAISARFAIAVPADRRTGPIRTASAAGWAISLLQPTINAFLLSPFWIPAAIGIVKGRPVLALAASFGGLIYAAVVFHFGIKNAGATLLAREPEIFKMLDPKAT
jgi:ABC-2 type transport system permease protein